MAAFEPAYHPMMKMMVVLLLHMRARAMRCLLFQTKSALPRIMPEAQALPPVHPRTLRHHARATHART
eukprot:8557716-Lingulodinium_polyedra.AAC.1